MNHFSHLPKKVSIPENKSMKILFLALMLFSSVLWAENSLTLYILPSPKGIDWSSPKKLLKSMIKNRWEKNHRFMGHVFVGLKCEGEEQLTGMSVKNFNYLSELILNNRGFGILYHSFQGRIENGNEIRPELDSYLDEGTINFSQFLLSSSNCQRIQNYLEEFKKFNIDKNYGLAHKPLYGEGSGCSAFGVSFLEVADILDQELKDEWSNYINIPPTLAGPPLRDEGVSLFKIFFADLNWAKENQDHIKLTFWDPDKMFQWVNKKINNPAMGTNIIQIKQSKGIQIDKTFWPTPQKPIWKKNH